MKLGVINSAAWQYSPQSASNLILRGVGCGVVYAEVLWRGAMSARLGNVLFWASILIAGGWVWLNYHYEQQNSAITWGGAALAWLVGRACQYVLGGDKLDDDKKQLEAKSEKDTNTISTESIEPRPPKSAFTEQLRQLDDIRRNPPRLILGQ
jgi:hypothetical protein